MNRHFFQIAEFSSEEKASFQSSGFIIKEDFLNVAELTILKSVVDDLSSSPHVDLYQDRNGLIRRMEKFTFLSDDVSFLNSRLETLIKALTGESYVLFKDKVNFKPSGGEGFYAHYDGVFQFKKNDGILKNGWYEYAPCFLNVLVALDDFTTENGPIEVSSSRSGDFPTLLMDTNCDGTPNLNSDALRDCNFVPILIRKGGLVVFKNTCPHRSGPNMSNSDRRSLYLTYNELVYGFNYHKYFSDKLESAYSMKSLAGDLVSEKI